MSVLSSAPKRRRLLNEEEVKTAYVTFQTKYYYAPTDIAKTKRVFEPNPFPVAFFRDFFWQSTLRPRPLYQLTDHSVGGYTCQWSRLYQQKSQKGIGKCPKCHKQDQIFLKMSLSFCPKITFLLIGVIWQKIQIVKNKQIGIFVLHNDNKYHASYFQNTF